VYKRQAFRDTAVRLASGWWCCGERMNVFNKDGDEARGRA